MDGLPGQYRRVACPTPLNRALAALRDRAEMDVAFAARVEPDGRAMRIIGLRGTVTRALDGLTITNGDGLGGKSLALAKPVQVTSYLTARGITHLYDHAVREERLETVSALPVRLGNDPRFVIYLANRSRTPLGDRWLDPLVPMLRDLERDLMVEEEVRRRLLTRTAPPAPAPASLPGPSAGELEEIAGELEEIAEQITDPRLRERLRAVRQRVRPAPVLRSTPSAHGLAPREVDVLAQIALGHTNAAAAEALGLLPNTVKSYLKTAMRKLGVSNRVQAIEAARALRVIR